MSLSCRCLVARQDAVSQLHNAIFLWLLPIASEIATVQMRYAVVGLGKTVPRDDRTRDDQWQSKECDDGDLVKA